MPNIYLFSRNNNYRHFILFLLLLPVVCIPLQKAKAQNATNYASVDSVKVGDTFDYSIVLRTDESYDQIIFPDSTHFGSPVSIVNLKRYKVASNTDSLSYTLQFFGTENHTIPKLPVRLVKAADTTTLYVPPVPLDFKTTLLSENNSILPLKPIFSFALNWWPYLVGFVLLLIAGYAGYRWYQKWKQAEEAESQPTFTPQPFTDPITELEMNLKEVRENSQLRQNLDFKTFYIELGDAIRWYLERVYDIPALESTTRELIRDLHHKAAPDPMIEKTEKILREADMVKFARFNCTLDQAFEALEEGEAFLKLARNWDQARIENVRTRHQQHQRELEAEFNSEEETEVSSYD